jgi:hypothetical protein
MRDIESHMQVDDATAAAYHHRGLEIRILDEDAAKEWAYTIIRQRQTPPVAIIEVATAPHRHALLDALRVASHGGDAHIAARLLLGHLHRELSADRVSVGSAITAATILFSHDPPFHDGFIDFIDLDEEIYLAEAANEAFRGNLKERALALLQRHRGETSQMDMPPGGSAE